MTARRQSFALAEAGGGRDAGVMAGMMYFSMPATLFFSVSFVTGYPLVC